MTAAKKKKVFLESFLSCLNFQLSGFVVENPTLSQKRSKCHHQVAVFFLFFFSPCIKDQKGNRMFLPQHCISVSFGLYLRKKRQFWRVLIKCWFSFIHCFCVHFCMMPRSTRPHWPTFPCVLNVAVCVCVWNINNSYFCLLSYYNAEQIGRSQHIVLFKISTFWLYKNLLITFPQVCLHEDPIGKFRTSLLPLFLPPLHQHHHSQWDGRHFVRLLQRCSGKVGRDEPSAPLTALWDEELLWLEC